MCLMACPMGGRVVTKEKIMKKCDLCSGSPRYAGNCPTKALQFLPLTKITRKKRRDAVQRMLKVHDEEMGGD